MRGQLATNIAALLGQLRKAKGRQKRVANRHFSVAIENSVENFWLGSISSVRIRFLEGVIHLKLTTSQKTDGLTAFYGSQTAAAGTFCGYSSAGQLLELRMVLHGAGVTLVLCGINGVWSAVLKLSATCQQMVTSKRFGHGFQLWTERADGNKKHRGSVVFFFFFFFFLCFL